MIAVMTFDTAISSENVNNMFLNPAIILNLKNIDRIKKHMFHIVSSNCHMRHYYDYHLTTSHIAAFNEEANVINAIHFCDKWDKFFSDQFFPLHNSHVPKEKKVVVFSLSL
jgi:hypothetical protein